MSSEFQKGEVVRLKSGGPNMTVENVGQRGMTGDPTVWCVWFDLERKRQRDTFTPEALERAPSSPPLSGRASRA